MKKLDEWMARSLLNAVHDAWCKGDVERLLSYCTEDCVYWSNAGAPDGMPFVVEGKPSLRTFFRSTASIAEHTSVVDRFHFEEGVARAAIEASIRHRRTGHVLVGSFRQVVTFDGSKIAKCEEFRDAARTAAFWRLVASDEAFPDST